MVDFPCDVVKNEKRGNGGLLYRPVKIACAARSVNRRYSSGLSCGPRAPRWSPDWQSSAHNRLRIVRARFAVIGRDESTLVERFVNSLRIVIFMISILPW
jgi:hypothetical protein